jgi:hypothetical protein
MKSKNGAREKLFLWHNPLKPLPDFKISAFSPPKFFGF